MKVCYEDIIDFIHKIQQHNDIVVMCPLCAHWFERTCENAFLKEAEECKKYISLIDYMGIS